MIKRYRNKQRGSVLIFALILMMVMTILAVSGVGNSVLEQHMSGNYYDSNTAFQSSEKGLRVAEQWLRNNAWAHVDPNWRDWFNNAAGNNGKQGLYSTKTVVSDSMVCRNVTDCSFLPTVEDEWGDAAKLPKGFVTLGLNELGGINLSSAGLGVEKQPQFIIEYLGQVVEPQIQMGIKEAKVFYDAFRITAIGWGKKSSTRHVLQSHLLLPR